jgi:hypothetical protein
MVLFPLLGPFAAWLAWRARNGYRKEEQLRRLKDDLADAGDITASPIDGRGDH